MSQTTIGDETFHVVFDGPDDAPVLVLSNSLGTDLHMWDEQIPALSRQFRVLRYDARGHGGSVVGDGPYSIAQLGTDVLRILDAHGIEKAHFVGLSLGGMVGQWLLTHAGDRVGRAVLANTTSHYPDPAPWNARIAAVRAGGMDGMADAVIERWFTPAFRQSHADVVAPIADMVRATPTAGYIGCCAALRDLDLREALRGVTHDVLVIVGDADPATPPELGWAIAQAIPGAQLVTLGAAHLSNVEMADAFTQALVAFLTAPPRRIAKTPAIAPQRRAPRTPIASRTIGRTARAKVTSRKAPTAVAPKPKATPGRKPAVKKVVAKKAAAKKAAPKKAMAKKTPAKKAVARNTAARKSAVKKTAARKAAPKKAAPKKTAPKTGTAKKSASKKISVKKGAVKKTAIKKAAPKKAARRVASKKTGRKTTRR